MDSMPISRRKKAIICMLAHDSPILSIRVERLSPLVALKIMAQTITSDRYIDSQILRFLLFLLTPRIKCGAGSNFPAPVKTGSSTGERRIR